MAGLVQEKVGSLIYITLNLSRVARYFLMHYTKEGEKTYQITTTLPNGLKIYQMAVKYSKLP
jgi:hypothetical protein